MNGKYRWSFLTHSVEVVGSYGMLGTGQFSEDRFLNVRSFLQKLGLILHFLFIYLVIYY